MDDFTQLKQLVEEKNSLLILLSQITDYLDESVSVDSSPTIIMPSNLEHLSSIRECIAILMETASEETKQKIKEELL